MELLGLVGLFLGIMHLLRDVQMNAGTRILVSVVTTYLAYLAAYAFIVASIHAIVFSPIYPWVVPPICFVLGAFLALWVNSRRSLW